MLKKIALAVIATVSLGLVAAMVNARKQNAA
jgi:hypothetical protein